MSHKQHGKHRGTAHLNHELHNGGIRHQDPPVLAVHSHRPVSLASRRWSSCHCCPESGQSLFLYFFFIDIISLYLPYVRDDTLISRLRKRVDIVEMNAFCNSVSCCNLWVQYDKSTMQKLKSAYGRIFRHLFNICDRLLMGTTN